MDSITSALVQEVDGIANGDVFIRENVESTTIGSLPPHSIRVVVKVGKGSDQDIGQKIWDTKAGGIKTFGAVAVNVTDQQGNSQTVNFDRSTLVPIFYTANITVDPSKFPQNQEQGKEDIKDALKTESEKVFTLGQNIINNIAECFVTEAVNGILTRVLLQSRDSGPPTLAGNITIEEDEEPTFTKSNFVVNIL